MENIKNPGRENNCSLQIAAKGTVFGDSTVTDENVIVFLSTALMYCSLDTLIGKLRGGEEDAFNSVGAATLTGMIFKSTAGLRPIAIAGALGGGLATAYHFGEKLLNSRGHSITTPNWAWSLWIQYMLLWTLKPWVHLKISWLCSEITCPKESVRGKDFYVGGDVFQDN